MLAVCLGNRDANDNNHKSCDAFRGSLPPHKQNLTVNPLNSNTLINIKYKDNGIIYSDNQDINSDLNDKLNLNCIAQLLPDCRANVLRALQEKVMEDNSGRTASKEYFKKLLDKYTKQDTYKVPYVGILIKWLESKLLEKRKLVSIFIPSIVASVMTFLMYIGEMFLLNGYLYNFGSGTIFNSIPGIVFAPIDLLIIVASGCVTALIFSLLNRKNSNSAELL